MNSTGRSPFAAGRAIDAHAVAQGANQLNIDPERRTKLENWNSSELRGPTDEVFCRR